MEEIKKVQTTNNNSIKARDKQINMTEFNIILHQVLSNFQVVLKDVIDKKYRIIILDGDHLRFYQLPSMNNNKMISFSTENIEKYWIAFSKPRWGEMNRFFMIEFNKNDENKMKVLYYDTKEFGFPIFEIVHAELIDASTIPNYNKWNLFEADSSSTGSKLSNFNVLDYLWEATENIEIASGGH